MNDAPLRLLEPPPTPVPTDRSVVADLAAAMEQVLIGKPEVVRLAIVTLLARGHLLLEDVPGVGKTTLALALARSVGGEMHRIQFTVDLLPSDIIGVTVFDREASHFEFRPGPVFSNIVLADEINRSTPKTQSALLEAMSEARVTVDNHTYDLPQPFMVIATQNPVEHHGTYPLPESQLDRFLLTAAIGYPDREHERRILRDPETNSGRHTFAPVVTPAQILDLQAQAEAVRVETAVEDYILDLVHALRDHERVELGISTRGAVHLYRACQALALVEGREYVVPDDVKRLAIPALAHRLQVRVRSGHEARGTLQGADVVEEVLGKLAVPL